MAPILPLCASALPCLNAVLSADLQVGETCFPSSVPLPSGGFKSYIKRVRWRSPGQLLRCAALLLTHVSIWVRDCQLPAEAPEPRAGSTGTAVLNRCPPAPPKQRSRLPHRLRSAPARRLLAPAGRSAAVGGGEEGGCAEWEMQGQRFPASVTLSVSRSEKQAGSARHRQAHWFGFFSSRAEETPVSPPSRSQQLGKAAPGAAAERPPISIASTDGELRADRPRPLPQPPEPSRGGISLRRAPPGPGDAAPGRPLGLTGTQAASSPLGPNTRTRKKRLLRCPCPTVRTRPARAGPRTPLAAESRERSAPHRASVTSPASQAAYK